MPEARQNNSKLTEIFDRASSFSALVGIAVDVVSLFIHGVAFLCGITTPSLAAQGGQRRFSYFNIERDNSRYLANDTQSEWAFPGRKDQSMARGKKQ
jgi:hypothetical protein